MAARCPGCGHELVESTWDAHYGARVTIDECHACNGLWFDGREAYRLTPGALLRLFKAVQAREASRRAALAAEHPCPRCGAALKETWDRVRDTSFSYLGCPAGCGRFSTFAQFLREKQLARDATAQELDALKARVKVVRCASCGAPIELLRTTVCGHCQAPVTCLGGAALAETLAQLKVPDASAASRGQEELGAQLTRALAELPGSQPRPQAPPGDLVALGVDALLALLR